MEILDIYDDNCNKLDKTIIRGNKIENGENIMLSVVFIKDSTGRYLIQKSSKTKGNKYCATGGHVIHNETPVETIIRETKEELGIKINKESIKFICNFKYPTKNCIFNVYELYIDNIDTNSLKLQTSEVESVQLLTRYEINELITNKNFLETHAYIFSKYIID